MSSKTLYALGKRRPWEYIFSDFQMLAWKLTKFLFQTASQFSFKICITLHSHDTYFLWNFLAKTRYVLNKKNPSKYNFLDFWIHKVTVYSNFASLFSIMKDRSTVFFGSNLIYFGQKGPIKVRFSEFWVVRRKFTKFLMSCSIKYYKPIFL